MLGLHLPVGGCLVTALALAAVWPADAGAAGAEVLGHVTTFNNDQIFTTPDIPLEDYGFAVHAYLSADLATRPGEMAADIRRSGLFYFGQQCDPAVVLRRPGAVEALRESEMETLRAVPEDLVQAILSVRRSGSTARGS